MKIDRLSLIHQCLIIFIVLMVAIILGRFFQRALGLALSIFKACHLSHRRHGNVYRSKKNNKGKNNVDEWGWSVLTRSGVV